MNRRLYGRLRWWGRAVLLAGVLLLAARWGITPSGGDDSRSAASLAPLSSCVLPAMATEPTREPLAATAGMRGFGCGGFTSDRVDTMWISEC